MAQPGDADYDKLDFWASLNNQTEPEFEYENDRTNWNNESEALNTIIARGPSDPRYQAAVTAIRGRGQTLSNRNWGQLAQDQTDQTIGDVARSDAYTDAINGQRGDNDVSRAAWQQGSNTAFQTASQGNNNLFAGLQGAQGTADASSDAAMGRYTGAVDRANGVADSGYGAFQDSFGDYGRLQANAYQGDAQSNAGDIARQQGAYDQLGGWASGANDISSDAGLVGQQQDVYGQFNQWASGANDISSDPGLVGMQQGVYDDYGQFASGAMDLESQAAAAAADPEAVAAQKEALGEFRDRMDPKLTDAERFLYMQSRLSQEQSQRAVRDANYRELERRGMGGSTMALSNLNASSAEASNTRALQDLGANAKAVDRAEKALVNYGNMSSTMREQSFGEDFATKSAADKMAVNNNQQRLQGIAGQGQMATAMRNADDDIKKFNSTQQMTGLQGAGMMANTMRGQDDAMRQGNANRQLAGAQSQGDMATSMRNAGDAMNMFNKEQQGIQLRHEDDFNAHQQDAAWGRETDKFGASQDYANGITEREGGLTRAGLTAADAKFGRAATTATTGVGINKDYVEGYDRLRSGAGQDRRDQMTELGAGADSEARATEIAQRGQGMVNTTRERMLDNSDEDRRAEDAVRAGTTWTPPEEHWYDNAEDADAKKAQIEAHNDPRNTRLA